MRAPPLEDSDDPPKDGASAAGLSGGTVLMAEMNEALLIGGLHQLELREMAERLNEQLRSEIAQREESE
ncbi:MAG TPA: hypothetical protein VL069_05770, partial [Opitutus sp.]|nr:hypothetical protein [Opitutus sp.]